MKGGFSGCSGIILYDTDKTDGFQAVYGYYTPNNDLILEKGSLKEMQERKNEREASFEREKSPEDKAVVILFLVMLAMVIFAFLFCPIVMALGVLAFCVISYMPVLVIIFTNLNGYTTIESQMQFRRFHGCEHAIINHLDKNNEWTVEALKSTSIYHKECGTVYSGEAILLAVIIALLIIFLPALGFFKAFGIFVATVILLFLNIFNPFNPFVKLQRPAIATPTERELYLGLAVADALWDVRKTPNNAEENNERK
ncbi:MAG: DUF1385 domain-containing protein [Firmicutes bacterium]|nr:DUF1385 domain-containing protein [Bacillota bacterium]